MCESKNYQKLDRRMSTGMVKEHKMEKQMGCMAGFLHIFDRHEILTGKPHYAAKRLPPSLFTDTELVSEKLSTPSLSILERTKRSTPPPADELSSKSLLRLELREVTRSPWKFGKEVPRLSLDSRATTDAKGGLHPREIPNAGSIISAAAPSGSRCESISCDATDESQQHRSPSVIARLMGLELLPGSSISEPEVKPQFRRSASESRVSRDLFQSRFYADKPIPYQFALPRNVAKDGTLASAPDAHPTNYTVSGSYNGEPPKSFNSPSPWRTPQLHCRGFLDSRDFFPEPKLTASEYDEIESKLRYRGIDEPSNDLDTLKQILQALQFKGLLYPRKPPENIQVRHRNFVYDRSPSPRLSNSSMRNRRRGNEYSSSCRNQISGVNYGISGENSLAVSAGRERNGRRTSPTATTMNDRNAILRQPNARMRSKTLGVETQRKNSASMENGRVSPIQSPKLSPRRTGLVPIVSSHSPRRRKPTAEIHQEKKFTTGVEDESASISGSSITTSTESEKSKIEDYKEGRHLLERCDKLLHTIAEISSTDTQPSPVSVLDSLFYKDESATPSPVTTRCNIDFKYQSNEGDDPIWAHKGNSDGSDFAYVSDILRASHHLHNEPDAFLLLEKQQYLKGRDPSEHSRSQRRLVFDTVHEILDRRRRLPPWNADRDTARLFVANVWSEFESMRVRWKAEDHDRDMFETVCGVLTRDLTRDRLDGWVECDEVGVSEAVLGIERLVFKDVVTETIHDLAAYPVVVPRRKLFF